jgi:hypothetical protein
MTPARAAEPSAQSGGSAPVLPVAIVGTPASASDAAVARFLARFLEREQPGTSWSVTR